MASQSRILKSRLLLEYTAVFLLLWTSAIGLAQTSLSADLRNGDVIGISDRKGVTPFLVQAVTRSPINHVGIVVIEENQPFVVHLFKKAIRKDTLSEFFDVFRSPGGETRYVLGRLKEELTNIEVKRMANYLNESTQDPNRIVQCEYSCSRVARNAYIAAGRTVGTVQSDDEMRTSAFNGLVDVLGRHHFFSDASEFVPPHSFFGNKMQIIEHNLERDSLRWNEIDQLTAWNKHGDYSSIARIFGKVTNVTPRSREAHRQAFLAHLSPKKKENCPWNQLAGIGPSAPYRPLLLRPEF